MATSPWILVVIEASGPAFAALPRADDGSRVWLARVASARFPSWRGRLLGDDLARPPSFMGDCWHGGRFPRRILAHAVGPLADDQEKNALLASHCHLPEAEPGLGQGWPRTALWWPIKGGARPHHERAWMARGIPRAGLREGQLSGLHPGWLTVFATSWPPCCLFADRPPHPLSRPWKPAQPPPRWTEPLCCSRQRFARRG